VIGQNKRKIKAQFITPGSLSESVMTWDEALYGVDSSMWGTAAAMGY